MKAKELVKNLVTKYSTCQSYSDSGTVVVTDNVYHRVQTSEFKTFYLSPSKFLFSISTKKTDKDRSDVVFWMSGDESYYYEDNNGKVSSCKVDDVLSNKMLRLESQPCFSIPLLIPGFKYVTNEVFENNFVLGLKNAEYHHLVSECKPLGRIDLWIDKTNGALGKIHVQRMNSLFRLSKDFVMVDCEYTKVAFDQEISEEIFAFKGAQ